MKKNHNTDYYYSTLQFRIPVDLQKIVEISDPVYTFNEVMQHIDLNKFLVRKENENGRPTYDAEKLLKVILFAFMENGYTSLRQIEKLCKTDIRYIWLLDGANAPSHVTISNFLNHNLAQGIEVLFAELNNYIFEKEKVDLRHTYIDGTKIIANANCYSWVWKKACLTSRMRLYSKITVLLEEINQTALLFSGVRFGTREEYTIEYMETLLSEYPRLTGLDLTKIPCGKGHRKSQEQRQYGVLASYTDKLKDYAVKIDTCGESRNSYSKTDKDATFMRVKKDYMGNDQLLPAYNMQIAVCDEYIAAIDVEQYASDMDCFVPLMERYKAQYGIYPEYPVADAGYGSYNNYLYCEENGMKKYMKYTMFAKETKNEKYRTDPFRSENFIRNESGELLCPYGKPLIHISDRAVRYNRYGRTEEIYECESCEGCPYKEKCFKGKGNRRISLNRELTSFHREVVNNLNSIQGALLRTNRSIQAEGVFGIMKWDRGYKRAFRRGKKAVFLEFMLLACGFNLYKYHNKTKEQQEFLFA